MKCPHCGDQHEEDCFCCPNSGKLLKLNCVNPDCKKLSTSDSPVQTLIEKQFYNKV